MSRLFSRRHQGESGAVIVLVAICLPALALLAAFAIDVSHWFDYSRNLQLRADAAALAGGDQYGGICAADPAAPATIAAMATVGKMAQLYSGPPGPASDLYYPYSGVNSPLAAGALPAPNSSYNNVPNLKAGTDMHYHVLLNSSANWHPGETSTSAGASFSMGVRSTFCSSTDENGNTGAMVDVRVTQDRLPLFFPLLNFKPTISAHARVAIQGVGQETNIRPIAVRDAGLTPCVTVNLVNTNPPGNVVKSVDLQFNKAATQTGGPDVWDNGAGSSVNVPSGANLYAQAVLHAQGADGTCNTSNNPLTYEQNSGLLLVNSYDDPPAPPSVSDLDPNADGTQSQWTKSSGTTAWNLLNDRIRQPTVPVTATRIRSLTITQNQDLAFQTLTWASGDTYTLWVYGNTSGETRRDIEYQISTNGGAFGGGGQLFAAGTSPSWKSVNISAAITKQADLDTLKVRLIHTNTGGNNSGTAEIDAAYIERTPGGQPPQIVGSATKGGVTLLNGGTCAPDAYFSTSASCGVKVCAIVWFTPDQTAESMTVNGAPMAKNGDPLCTTSVPGATAWASNVIAVNPLSGQHQFSLTATETSASACGVKNGNPQSCSTAFGVQQQAFAACDGGNPDNTCPDPNDSGPIVLAEIGNATTLENTVGSFHSGTHTLTITLEIKGLSNAKVGDPPTILKYSPSGEQQTGLIDCGQNNGAGGASQLKGDKSALFNGCPRVGEPSCQRAPGYGYFRYCAPLIKSANGLCNNALRSTTPGVAVDCVNVNNGNVASVPPCLESRIVVGGGTGKNPCNPPNGTVTCSANGWATQTFLPGDPRAVTMIVTYPADLSKANIDVPIRTFATFYITGWHVGGQDPDCGAPGVGNPGANETIPGGGTKGEIWGHWISYVDPAAGGNGQPCNFQAFGNCAAVLSR